MRVSVFVDGANFFYMQRDKLKWFTDPKKILDFIQKKTQGELVNAFYYVGVDVPPEAKQENFLKALPNMGYTPITKGLKNILLSDGTTKQKANLDVEIVLDMFNTIDHYDMAVLISGDGDFERPLQLLRARGKRFLVMSTQGMIAEEIRREAGMHYIDFQDIRTEVEKPEKIQLS
jgi:uncharacterized LabA/DUF88 family protein